VDRRGYSVVALVAEGGWAGQNPYQPAPAAVHPGDYVRRRCSASRWDYEVFLIARIKQEREPVGDARAGVTAGVARTAPHDRLRHGLCLRRRRAQPRREAQADWDRLATAIMMDATIVRIVLAPALMRLLGECAWWTPRRWAAPRAVADPPAPDRRHAAGLIGRKVTPAAALCPTARSATALTMRA
jgi:putative drug exporter of the RND superfamily